MPFVLYSFVSDNRITGLSLKTQFRIEFLGPIVGPKKVLVCNPEGGEHIGRLGRPRHPSTLLKYFCKQQKIVVIYTERRIIGYDDNSR